MFEESVTSSPSIWTSMNSWFTPTVLFVLLNLMIGTIFFTSTQQQHPPQQKTQENQENQENDSRNKIQKSPSVLQRLKSINFYSHRSPQPIKQESQTHYLFDQNTLQDSKTLFHFDQTLEKMTPETNTLLDFDQAHLLQTQERGSHFDFHQTLGNTQETNTLLDFGQTHVLQTQGRDSHFDFHQTLENIQETNTLLDFERTHVGQNHGNDSHFNFEPTLENTHLDYNQTLKNLENTHLGYNQTLETLQENTHLDFEQLDFSLDEVYSQLTGSHVSRTTSDTKPASGEVPPKLPTKMKKSASMKSSFNHFGENDIVETRRPATVRERRAKATEVDDVEVDAKADDFINKFKEQLKLQRMDSIVRYKEMVGKGRNK